MKKRAKENLIAKSIRPSQQRVAILGYLLKNKTHPCAEEIYEALLPEMPTLSKTTVYNTLHRLAGQCVISMLDIDPANKRFDGTTAPHGHFICTGCGSIEDVMVDDILFAEKYIPAGALVSDFQLYYKGLCGACRKREDAAAK